MPDLDAKINRLAARDEAGEPITIAILGLGSVGHYLLGYLLGLRDPRLRLCVVGRDPEKLRRDVNIFRVAGLIREDRAGAVEIFQADFASVDSLAETLGRIGPDFIVNSSRAYSGLKYGTLSWKAVRAYGLWAPLAVKYPKNILRACAQAASPAVVINTSYSDAVNAWLKSAGGAFPEFGSGNLNHLVPRLKLAVAGREGTAGPIAPDEVDVTLATSHFHDVVISKEGTTEGLDPLLRIELRGRIVEFDPADLYRRCALAMPVDAKRNMMNASSNFEIIAKLLAAFRGGRAQKLHVPGFDGLLGGYPVEVRRQGASWHCGLLETPFSRDQMVAHNRQSLYLDGVADVREGTLHYTPELREKVQRAFGCDLPSAVPLSQSDDVADLLIDQIIARRA